MFAGPYVTSVGGTTLFRPEIAAELSGGGFSFYFERPVYQDGAVLNYLEKFPDNNIYIKCAHCQFRCRDMTFSYFVICAAVVIVATPISPRKRSITIIS